MHNHKLSKSFKIQAQRSREPVSLLQSNRQSASFSNGVLGYFSMINDVTQTKNIEHQARKSTVPGGLLTMGSLFSKKMVAMEFADKKRLQIT